MIAILCTSSLVFPPAAMAQEFVFPTGASNRQWIEDGVAPVARQPGWRSHGKQLRDITDHAPASCCSATPVASNRCYPYSQSKDFRAHTVETTTFAASNVLPRQVFSDDAPSAAWPAMADVPTLPDATTANSTDMVFAELLPTPSVLDGTLFALEDPEVARLTKRDLVIRAQNGGVLGTTGRLRFDYGEDSGDDARIRGQLMLGLGPQLAIDAETIWLDHTTNDRWMETLWVGDVNLVYRLNSQRINLRFGGGANYKIYDGDADFGYNLTYSTDFFISRPWLVSGEVDWGELAGDELFHWRVTGGYALGVLEIYAGYDSYKLGQWKFQGPVAGLGLSF